MSFGLADDMKPEVLMLLNPGEERSAVEVIPFEIKGEKADAPERARRARILSVNFIFDQVFHLLPSYSVYS